MFFGISGFTQQILFGFGYVGYQFCGEGTILIEGTEVIREINRLMGILVGFYIAALAAVASFRSDTLDKVLSGRPVRLANARQGREKQEILTRRRFLAVLFGYCASLSICLYIVGAVESHFAIGAEAEAWLRQTLLASREVILALYAWALSSLLVVTFLGLHYLVERMHRP